MIDKLLYNFFGSIDTFFECIENLYKKIYERHKITRKTQSRNTAKEKTKRAV